VIELPRSTFYYRSTAAIEDLADERLAELIGDIQDELPGYGYRRVTRELQRRGHLVNHKRIARVMKDTGLGIRPRRRFVRTTDSAHDLPIGRSSATAGPNSEVRQRLLWGPDPRRIEMPVVLAT
jgi:putative transposase